MMEPTLFTKPKAQSPEKTEPSTKLKSYIWGNIVKVAHVIAWYANPTVYVLFSVVYFMVGMTL